MASPTDRRYAESHEWHLVDGDTVTLGITKFAVDELTDITYVEMQGPGTVVEAGGTVGEIESVKATSEVYSAVGGEIIEVNSALEDDPGLVNRDPFGEGWLIRLKVADTAPLDSLVDAAAYDQAHS